MMKLPRTDARPFLRAGLAGLALFGAACSKDPPSATPTKSGEGASTQPTNAETTAPEVKEGAAAPAFSRKAHDGVAVGTAEAKGKYLVVYFYPKDETPGCTKEACSFRDAWNDLSKQNVLLVGVSGDDDASHKAFAEHHKLPFHLVADVEGSLAKTFGVPFNAGFAARQTFIIAPDGTVKKIFRSVDVTTHAAEIAAATK